MYAKVIGLKSVRDINYEFLIFKLKSHATLKDADRLARDIVSAGNPITAKRLRVVQDKAILY